MDSILFKFKMTLFSSFIVVRISVSNSIILLITLSRVSIVQASSSFKHLYMHMFMYATPTFITEAHCLVTQVQLLLTTVTVN